MAESQSASPRRRFWRVTLGLLAGVAAIAILTIALRSLGIVETPELFSLAPPDSWSYRPTGFRALHDVLGRLDYRCERWLRSYATLPDPSTTVLLSLGPDPQSRFRGRGDRALEEDNARRLRDWIEEGGIVLLGLPGRREVSLGGVPIVADETLSELDGVAPGKNGILSPTFTDTHGPIPQLSQDDGDLSGFEGAGRLATFVEDYPMFAEPLREAIRSYLRPDDRPPAFEDAGDYEPLLHLGGQPIVLEKPLGTGRAVAASTPLLFSNGGLRQAPIAATLCALIDEISDQGRRLILIDEYVHGYTDRGGFLRWARETPLFYPLVSTLLAILLVAWRGAVRLGPPRIERQLPRRAKEEFILSLAQLYRRAGHREHTAHQIARGYEVRASKLLGRPASSLGHRELFLPRRTDDENGLLAEARRLHDEYVKILEELPARSGPHPSPTQAIGKHTI